MKDVPEQCHVAAFIGAFRGQYDDRVAVPYDQKLAEPGHAIMHAPPSTHALTEPAFDEKTDRAWFRRWRTSSVIDANRVRAEHEHFRLKESGH